MSLQPSVLRERMTLDEWSSLDEDVEGEFVDGALVEEEVPTSVHEVVLAWILAALFRWRPTRRVLVLGAGLKLRVSSRRGRIPDAVVYLENDPRPPSTGASAVPPSIVVEIVSPTARDARRDRGSQPRE